MVDMVQDVVGMRMTALHKAKHAPREKRLCLIDIAKMLGTSSSNLSQILRRPNSDSEYIPKFEQLMKSLEFWPDSVQMELRACVDVVPSVPETTPTEQDKVELLFSIISRDLKGLSELVIDRDTPADYRFRRVCAILDDVSMIRDKLKDRVSQ